MNKMDSTYVLRTSKKIRAIRLLGGRCVRCGETNPVVLDFHHEGDKNGKVSYLSRYRWSRYWEEVKKCQLLCRNCHLDLHYPEPNKMKLRLLTIKGVVQCCRCGYKSNVACLDFHHRNKREKLFGFGTAHNNHMFLKTMSQIVRELEKCEVLCRNCHALSHFDSDRFGRFSDEIEKAVCDHKEKHVVGAPVILELLNLGMRKIDIAKQLKCSKSLITYTAQKAGWIGNGVVLKS
jgi:hypothetical protein